jgi:hypothetical protein
MMNEYEVPEFIGHKLPEIESHLKDILYAGDISESMQILTDYTKAMVLQKDFKKAGICLELAEKIFKKGNSHVKQAVKDVFVFSFSCLKLACRGKQWYMLLAYMPSTLYGLYLNQMQSQAMYQ